MNKIDSQSYQTFCMTLDRKTYSDLAERLSNNTGMLRLMHASLGIAGEAGEVVDIVKKSVMYDKPIDRDTLLEECGDVLWYMSLLFDELGSNFEEVMQRNFEKLSKRYPTGFSESHAIKRMDKKR